MPKQLDKSNALYKRRQPLRGVKRDLDPFIPGDLQGAEGLWTCDGFHTNVTGALTKFPGWEEDQDLGASDIDGIYETTLDGTEYQFAFHNGEVHRIDTTPSSQLASGLTAGIVSGRTLANRFFFANGSENRKITSSLNVQNWGITAPSSAPTVATGAAGTMTGTYLYKFTYYNSTLGIESDPSPASSSVSPSSEQVDLSGMTASSDAQVDRKRIYRTVDGGAVYLFLVEINNATTVYTDNEGTDSNLGDAVSEDNGVPPTAKYVEVYNGMVLVAGLANPNESRVAVSQVLTPESFNPDDVYDFDPQESDTITAIRKFGQSVAVCKRSGIWLMSGTAPAFMQTVRTRVTEGPLGNQTLVPYQGYLFYLSEKGPYAFGGVREEYLGRSVEDIYKDLDLSALSSATGVYYPALNMIMWNVTSAGLSSPDKLLVFNVITKEWTTQPLPSTYMSTYLNAQAQRKWWIGTSDGKVGTGDKGNDNNGSSIACEVVTRGFLLGKDTDTTKQFRHLMVNYKPNGGSANVTVDYSINDPEPSSWINLGTFSPATGYVKIFDFGATVQGEMIFIRFTVTSSEPLVLRNIQVWGYDTGRTR